MLGKHSTKQTTTQTHASILQHIHLVLLFQLLDKSLTETHYIYLSAPRYLL